VLLDEMERGVQPVRSGLPAVRRTLEFLFSLYKAALTRRPVERGEITPEDPIYRGMTYALAHT
jgi:hypothetical protein